MSEAKLVKVGTFLSKGEAEIALGALKAEGIEAMITPDDAGGEEPSLWMGGVTLLARAGDAERAQKILGEKRKKS
jgi:hypothetical protein